MLEKLQIWRSTVRRVRHHKDTSFMLIYALNLMKTAYPCGTADSRVYATCVQQIFSKMVLRWYRGDKLLNKSLFFYYFFYFAQKKCSGRFINFRLNHWWQMDYSDDADLDTAIYYAVSGTVTSLPVFIQNILNCVQKTNKAFTSLERREGN